MRRPATRTMVGCAATIFAIGAMTGVGSTANAAKPVQPAPPGSSCQLGNGIDHLVQIQFDNVHRYRGSGRPIWPTRSVSRRPNRQCAVMFHSGWTVAECPKELSRWRGGSRCSVTRRPSRIAAAAIGWGQAYRRSGCFGAGRSVVSHDAHGVTLVEAASGGKSVREAFCSELFSDPDADVAAYPTRRVRPWP
jgi:hypothetical protein